MMIAQELLFFLLHVVVAETLLWQRLVLLVTLEKEKNRLIEITVDGEITKDEYEDFVDIQKKLMRVSVAVDSLRFWVEKTIADGRIDKELLKLTKEEQ